MKKSKRTISRDEVVIEFRKKLIKGGDQSLKWWRRTYVPKLTYGYFIKQINQTDSMQDDLLEAIREYVK